MFKKLTMYALMFVVTGGAMIGLGEVVLRLFAPVEYLSPRYQYSRKYGFTLFENTRMEHVKPGKFKYFYTVNEYGYRGEPVRPGAEGAPPGIVVLGDSYTFGIGVNDGEEYPKLLGDRLEGRYRVVNLGNPGWGLTQEIRRYYDFGSFYHPRLVVLQFCSNDPEDNFNNRVTRLENGEFHFVDSSGGINWIKKYLSRSFLQKTQLYNFLRGPAYQFVKNRLVAKKEMEYQQESGTSSASGPSPQAELYCELLRAFAERLQEEGTELLVIAVNDQLDRHPDVRRCIGEMDSERMIRYIEVVPWFEGVTGFESAEGHVWGPPAHRIVADGLADYILGMSQ